VFSRAEIQGRSNTPRVVAGVFNVGQRMELARTEFHGTGGMSAGPRVYTLAEDQAGELAEWLRFLNDSESNLY
jgi:hypothetical protein